MNATDKGTVLIVDDEIRITDILDLYLRKEGYRTHKAQDGFQALALMEEHVPDLVISDLMMPKMDGTALCKEAKTRPEFNNPYFIMLTARTTLDSKIQGLTIGADDYITKPFNVKELVARVNSAMRVKALQNEIVEKNVELERYKDAMEKELQLAAKFQESLIPEDGTLGNRVRLRSVFQPAIHIGGDIYDVRNSPEGDIVFFVADVTGHGIVAALISAMIKLSFMQAISGNARPLEIARKVNRDIVHTTSEEHFASMLLGRLDRETRTLTVIRAGHPAGMLCNHQNGVTELNPRGFLLGIDIDADFEEITVPVSAGDRILMFTDGISEAENEAGEQFGVDRIRKAFMLTGSTTDALMSAIRKWTGERYHDDVTLIELEILS